MECGAESAPVPSGYPQKNQQRVVVVVVLGTVVVVVLVGAIVVVVVPVTVVVVVAPGTVVVVVNPPPDRMFTSCVTASTSTGRIGKRAVTRESALASSHSRTPGRRGSTVSSSDCAATSPAATASVIEATAAHTSASPIELGSLMTPVTTAI